MWLNAWSPGRDYREKKGLGVHCGMEDGMGNQWSSVFFLSGLACCHSLLRTFQVKRILI
jgi:hypothetical protein